MAEKVGAKSTKGAKGTKAARKAKSSDVAAKGHNMVELKEMVGEFREEFNRLKDEQEKLNGEYSVDFGNLLEKAANKTGLPKIAVRMGLNEQRREIKMGARLSELVQSDQEATLLVAEALGLQTPFAQFLKRQVAKDRVAAKTEKAEDKA